MADMSYEISTLMMVIRDFAEALDGNLGLAATTSSLTRGISVGQVGQ
jgi:hypothetical protein